MSKDPAFLFYPNDYIGGTMGMSFEEKGAYMEILMMQFNRGHMTSHMIAHTVGQLWVKLEDKFIQDEDGFWYNQRLEEEQNKRKAYTVSRRNNVKGLNQHSKKENKTGHMTSHMENEDENIDIIKKGKQKKSSEFEIKNIHKSIPDYIYEHYTDEQVRERMLALAPEMLNSGMFLDNVARSINKKPEVAKKEIQTFLREIEVSRECFQTLTEIKRHFKNTIKKKYGNKY